MGNYVSILLMSGAFFAAVAVLLTAQPRISRQLTAIAGGAAFLGGLLVYGYGYIATSDSFLQAALRTVFAVCRMFIGEADFGDISEAPLFALPWAVTVCWCVHVLAFYATSSAAISLIGANALKNLRVRLSSDRDLSILYGINDESVDFGQALIEDTREIVVYVTEDPEDQLTETVVEAGGVIRSDGKAVSGNVHFLKSLGIRRGTRRVTLYALDKDYLKNLDYAKALLEAFQARGIRPPQISLVIQSREDDAVKQLQVAPDRFGYGFVTVFQEPELTARLLIQKYPPSATMTFDDTGAAATDFEALVVGFGQVGQNVLRSIIMNAQFEGSTFRADIFDPDLRENSGFFKSCYQGLLDHYQLVFHDHDGRSEAMYAYLNQRLDKIKYICICTGSDKRNEEIEEELRGFFRHKGRQIAIHQCSRRGIRTTDTTTDLTTVHSIYHPDVLSTRKLDAMAMAVNHYYMGSYGKGLIEDWMDCDYFSRQSSRAFADSIQTVLRVAGRTEQQAREGQWEFSPALLENLGRMEHARWNAFHFAMGFLPMSREEYAERTRIYQQQKAENGKASIRIGKNLARKTHACLISWEELDVLSETENSITGGSVDYKQLDRNNVLLVPTLLQLRDRESSRLDS